MHQLRPYQDQLIRRAAELASQGHKRIIAQAPTGAGKSVVFASLIHRYLQRNPGKKVLIACHREKLVFQSRKALYDWYGTVAEPVLATTKRLPQSQVYSGMAETLFRRFSKRPSYLEGIGLLVVDEAHLGLFNKVMDTLPGPPLVIGFTATPISATKKIPLKDNWHAIACGPQINDLIHEGSLTPNITHRVKGSIDRKQLKIKNGEFDSAQMGALLSSTKHVQNTVEAYDRFALGRKTIIFNASVEHSGKVTEAFLAAGYTARHLDGYQPKSTQRETLDWFERTPGAILCNVAVATTGFDIPSIDCVIVNKATKSLPLYLQMCGRGSRLYPGKERFVIIDMGKNYLEHGDWSDDRDWKEWFENPEKPGKGGGVAPVKDCPACEAMLHASLRVCPHCGADVSAAASYDDELVEFETVIQGRPLTTAVPLLVHEVKASGMKEYAALHRAKEALIRHAAEEWGVKKLDDAKAYKLLSIYHEQVAEFCKTTGRKFNQWHKDISKDWLFAELEKKWGWKPQPLTLALSA